MKEQLIKDFKEAFKEDAQSIYFSPGRVNLIGEHTDYNGGMVFPCAITIGTYGIVSKRSDSKMCFYSNNFKDKGIITVDLNDLHYDKEDDWANYAKGVTHFIKQAGYEIPGGLNILVEGNIPNSSGLSSSASLEVLIGTILKGEFNLEIDMVEIVKIAQKAENEFIGVNCGIMDQFIIGMGKKDCATALDTSNLHFTYAPVILQNERIVIMNTNKPRGLVDSKYNERRAECEHALEQLQAKLNIKSLCELTPEQFEENKELITDPVERKRAKHAIYENDRVKKAIPALKANDIKTFGIYMNDSHISLRDDYEVTGIELDTLVSSAWKQKGVLGARMTGAGFGGCAIAIVEEDKIDDFTKNVEKEYTDIIGYAPSFYIASIGDGARKIKSL